ncbi:MAG TPA: site-specific integrase [Methanomassiliicoccales archaeon]|jgi:integrase
MRHKMENEIDVFSSEQLREIIKAADSLRDRCAIGLGVEAACRVTEMQYWRPTNFDFRFRTAMKWDVKKKEARKIGITPQLAEQVSLYINTAKIKGDSPLFPGRDPAKPLSVKSFDQLLKDLCVKCKIEGWPSWHDLRHTYVSLAAIRNVTIDEVRYVTGDSLATIMRYYRKPIPQDMGKWMSDFYMEGGK